MKVWSGPGGTRRRIPYVEPDKLEAVRFVCGRGRASESRRAARTKQKVSLGTGVVDLKKKP